MWPLTAVLPIRFAVPTTASAGTPAAGRGGGRNAKSAPEYSRPAASAWAISLKRVRSSSTGSSLRSTTRSAPWRRAAPTSAAAGSPSTRSSGTP